MSQGIINNVYHYANVSEIYSTELAIVPWHPHKYFVPLCNRLVGESMIQENISATDSYFYLSLGKSFI